MPGSPQNIEFHPAARAELLEAIDWYNARSPVAATEFAREIEQALERIHEAPLRYPETRSRHRRFVLLNYPFDVVYRLSKNTIEILAISHHSRRPGYWNGR
jgi:toxin ParE1/3/4